MTYIKTRSYNNINIYYFKYKSDIKSIYNMITLHTDIFCSKKYRFEALKIYDKIIEQEALTRRFF